MQKAGLVLCGLVLAWAAYAMLHNLGVGPLAVYDEGTYAKVAEESLARHDFLTFTLWGNLWFEKPPLYFWLAGPATALTHSEVLGIRLPAALFGIGVVALVMLLAYRTSRTYFVAALAGALLLSTPLFVQGAREARLDLLVSFCILAAYLAALEKKYVWVGIAVALAVMAKSVLAVFAAAAVVLISIWSGEWGWIHARRFWLGVGVAFVIVAPWHIYEWWQWGAEFWRQYIGYHVLARYETNLFGRPDLQTDYMARLVEQVPGMLGALAVACVAAPLYVSALTKRERTELMVPLSLLALMALVFFTAQTRALSYLIPLYPLAALFVSLGAWHLYTKGMIR